MTSSTLSQPSWLILRNHEGRYSLAPAAHSVPAGWEIVGRSDSREGALAEIATLWTDMRPTALREAMA